MIRDVISDILKELIISSKNKAHAEFKDCPVESLVYFFSEKKEKERKEKTQPTHSQKTPLVLKTNLNFCLCSEELVFMF